LVAGTSLFALLDDIASILDDIALMSKVAAKKTAGVLGDDLALNAHQVAGVHADRELPVVWAVARGSLRNKVILVPTALAISAFIPRAVAPLLMVGGAYLCYEGFEKIAHQLTRENVKNTSQAQLVDALANPAVDIVAFERDKIRGAVRTDFILSAEIIVIALGTVAMAPLGQQVAVMSAVAIIMTAGVYGIVAGIVKLDDAGLYLSQKSGSNFGGKVQRAIGAGLLESSPFLMKGLSIGGTVAMFMVGGGILTHGIPGAHDLIDRLADAVGAVPGVGRILKATIPTLLDVLAGIVAGALVLIGVQCAARLPRAIRGKR
jgi:predicted DNA repair protein MutK